MKRAGLRTLGGRDRRQVRPDSCSAIVVDTGSIGAHGVRYGTPMPLPTKTDNSHVLRPTDASDDERAGMKRALEREDPADLFARLESENDAFRAIAAAERRKTPRP